MTTFTDVRMVRNDRDGVYDLDLDADARDLATTGGLETALLCSLFSDRRAAVDEVADPWRRRGWIGNLLSDIPADNYGSGLWLYEQHRATSEVRASLRMEVIQSLDWLADEALVSHVDADVVYDPRKRQCTITIAALDQLGNTSRHAYQLWRETGSGTVGTNT
jgi:phage gp46-like protein